VPTELRSRQATKEQFILKENSLSEDSEWNSGVEIWRANV
jgi:hypothetical protein